MGDLGVRTGGCLCGAARFTAAPVSQEVDACHCSRCRKFSGGVYLGVPCAGVAFEDEDALGLFPSSEYGERGFCRTCGASLFWRMRDRSATVISLQAFDDQSGFVFAEEIFVDDKPAHYAFANETRKLTGEEFFARAMAQQESSGG